MTETVRGLKNALAYTRLYRDQTFVVKLGGEILADPRALDTVAAQLALLESLSIRIVVVHGGGPQASNLAARLGLESRMVAGRRVTTPEILEVAKMVYGGTLNVDVTTALRRHGLAPVGLTGIDGGMIVARKRPPVLVRLDDGRSEMVDYGRVGDLERVDTSLLTILLDSRYVPVVASLAGDADGAALNVNADTVAEAIASAIAAKKLIFMTSVPGLLRDPADPGSLIPFADVEDLEPLLASGAITGGMRPKIEACVRAVKSGVRRTHVVDGRLTDALLVEVFTGGGCGTMIVDRKEMTDYREHELAELEGLLAELVRTPSVSGTEQAAAERLESWARAQDLPVIRDDAGVFIVVEGRDPGPTLWLASHLDTVPAGDGWPRDPFAAIVERGVLHGRGASDAKASVAAMAYAAREVARSGGPARGRLVVLATFGEETANTTMPVAVQRLGAPDAAIVGEPTSLEPCVAQRGLVIVHLRWTGTAGHAGWAAANPGQADNAIEKGARDLVRLSGLRFPEKHPILGWTAATVTRIEGGTASNVVPESCTATIDVRTTPAYPVDDVVGAIAREAPSAEVELVSRRFLPCETPAGSRLLPAILGAKPGAKPFGSPTASDWVFLRDTDAVKLGPGDSRLSHTNEERVSLDEVKEAARLYGAIARRYLS